MYEVYRRRSFESLVPSLRVYSTNAALNSQVTNIQWTCLNQTNSATLSSSDPTCTMSEICGFGGFQITDGTGGPNQSFRFFVPIFLHAGILHLLVNMAVQCFGSTAQVKSQAFPRLTEAQLILDESL